MTVSITRLTSNDSVIYTLYNSLITEIETALRTGEFAILNGTRDMTAISGNVSYTGANFAPHMAAAIAHINNTVTVSMGFAHASNRRSYYQHSGITGWGRETGGIITLYSGAGVSQIASVNSWDTDGITLTWTRTGSPTGTGTFDLLLFP